MHLFLVEFCFGRIVLISFLSTVIFAAYDKHSLCKQLQFYSAYILFLFINKLIIYLDEPMEN